ncbi:tlde1 domain-containing protein [Acidocella sp.]|uniref:tlde1 domain-containing protein n=1 Tax=Acidocella sp. TaxID=50710 RepID=UPI003CFE3CE7
MAWTYSQSTGELSENGRLVGKGYSGTQGGRNNPAMQSVPNIGPIPQGSYTIGAPHDTTTHGPYVMRLTPVPGSVTFGRNGFLIHGDNRRHDASQGCIIMGPQIRHKIWASGDHRLQVTQ